MPKEKTKKKKSDQTLPREIHKRETGRQINKQTDRKNEARNTGN